MRFITGKPNTIDIKNLTNKLQDTLESGVLTNNGPRVQELEEKFTEIFGRPCVAFGNATQGLEGLCTLLGTGKDIWSVPSYSFIATASCTKAKSFNFLDINDYYQSIDNSKAKFEKTIHTSLFGSFNPDTYSIIKDNAHGIGVKYRGKPIAQYSDNSVYSLHSTKFLNSIEGGIIVCTEDLVEPLKQYRNFGYNVNTSKRFSGELMPSSSSSTNAKMSEIHATVGLHNLRYLDFLISINEERYNWYKKYLCEKVSLIKYPDGVESNYSYIVIRVNKNLRDSLCESLYKDGIYVRTYFMPIHKVLGSGSLENTEKVYSEVIALPQGLQLKSEADVYYICNKINQFIKRN